MIEETKDKAAAIFKAREEEIQSLLKNDPFNLTFSMIINSKIS